MPLQNRVTPFGEIVAVPERGTLMGNRGGCLCSEPGTLSCRRWTSRRWILCVLEYRGWRREVMQVGQYTELFFLDECTGLAAGHRPCAFCRPEAFKRFKHAWLAGNPGVGLPSGVSIDSIDRILHTERLHGRDKRTHPMQARNVPPGGMAVFAEEPERALLRTADGWAAWSPAGYGPCEAVDAHVPMFALTPPSTLNALAAGYSCAP